MLAVQWMYRLFFEGASEPMNGQYNLFKSIE